jgi:hypothetical protein
MTTRYFLIVRDGIVAPVRAWLQDHPLLDPRSGGGQMFTTKLAEPGDPDDGSVVRAWMAEWKLEDTWFQEVQDEYGRRNFKVNVTTPNWDASYYSKDYYSRQEVLDDQTRKPDRFKIVTAPGD